MYAGFLLQWQNLVEFSKCDRNHMLHETQVNYLALHRKYFPTPDLDNLLQTFYHNLFVELDDSELKL